MTRMIIFGNRAHYSAIGGVENSIRSMLKVVSQRQAIMVCREPLNQESMDLTSLDLPEGIELITYKDEYERGLVRRLSFLRHGGEILPEIYRALYKRFPDATLIMRHHMHVLAAYRAGYRDIRYLVPSLTINQLRENLSGASIFGKINIMIHMWVDGWLQSKALAVAQLFVFSASMQDQVRHRLPGQAKGKSICLVKPGIDDTRFMPASANEKTGIRTLLGLPLDKKLFLFVGRFVQAKGLDYLLGAFALQSTDCYLILLGEGESELSMRQRIDTLGIGDRVVWVGTTSRVENYYRACDVFVMSSTYEPLGQTILEAAACGIGIAAFGAHSGVITATHELGLGDMVSYANKLDAESLAEAMSRVMDLSMRPKMALLGKSVSKSYSWETLLGHLIE